MNDENLYKRISDLEALVSTYYDHFQQYIQQNVDHNQSAVKELEKIEGHGQSLDFICAQIETHKQQILHLDEELMRISNQSIHGDQSIYEELHKMKDSSHSNFKEISDRIINAKADYLLAIELIHKRIDGIVSAMDSNKLIKGE